MDILAESNREIKWASLTMRLGNQEEEMSSTMMNTTSLAIQNKIPVPIMTTLSQRLEANI